MKYGKKVDKFIRGLIGTDVRGAMYATDEDLNYTEVSSLEDSEFVILSKGGNMFRISLIGGKLGITHNARTYKSIRTQADMISLMEEHLFQ